MGLAWGVGYQIFFHFLDTSFNRLRAQLFFWGIFFFSWLGAKILFLISYKSNDDLLLNANFWLGGGFVFYGGLIGGGIFLILFKLFNRSINLQSIWSLFPALTGGHGIGRLGCYLAGCCYGEKTDLFWGLFQHGEYRHPTQLLESSFLFLFCFFALKVCSQKSKLIVYYFIGYGLIRIFVETMRGDEVRGSWATYTPSTWISFGLIGLGLLLHFLSKSHNLKKTP